MKNIHLLPTDKPSRLWITKLGNLIRCNDIKPIKKALGKNVNIYITSDEKIKDSNWVYDLINNFVFQINIPDPLTLSINEKKIILTTDQDLIKDGIQAIDDEFLEWFIKNPSCEFVEIEKQMLCEYCGQENCDNLRCRGYKDSLYYDIIIPKEEPKPFKDIQQLTKVDWDKFKKNPYISKNCICGKETYCDCRADKVESYSESLIKQETFEKAAKNYSKITLNKNGLMSDKQVNGFIAGAKWQAERMYSEEDMRKCWNASSAYAIGSHKDLKQTHPDFKEWFEQFKKK